MRKYPEMVERLIVDLAKITPAKREILQERIDLFVKVNEILGKLDQAYKFIQHRDYGTALLKLREMRSEITDIGQVQIDIIARLYSGGRCGEKKDR